MCLCVCLSAVVAALVANKDIIIYRRLPVRKPEQQRFGSRSGVSSKQYNITMGHKMVLVVFYDDVTVV